MPWLQVSIRIPRERSEAAERAFEAAGAVSVTLGDAEDHPVLEPAPGETPLWPEVVATGLFEADVDAQVVVTQLATALGLAQDAVTAVRLEDQDWECAWMADFHPMRFGTRLWICPSSHPPPDPNAVNIDLDPGLAFGTGTHPTTALCLEWLDAHPPSGALVVDYGCGSGILAIAALKLGARRAWAVDIDPQALVATEANAAKNAIAPTNLYTVEPQGLPPLKADLLMANILSGPLVELAPRLAALVRPGGRIVLSGILCEQAPAVLAAYEAWFAMRAPVERDGWVRLEGTKSVG